VCLQKHAGSLTPPPAGCLRAGSSHTAYSDRLLQNPRQIVTADLEKNPTQWKSAKVELVESVEKVQRLNPRWIIPSHYDYLHGALHRRRFAKLYGFDWPEEK